MADQNIFGASVLAATGAIAAAVAAIWHARAAKRAHESTLFLEFGDRYNSPDMAAALRRLASFYHENVGQDFANLWNVARKKMKRNGPCV